MRADWISMTHNGTGGTGNLTCVAASGYPTFGSVVNVPRIVEYTILQYTDASFATLAQAETGRGSYTPSSGILTRDVILRTWNGSAYLPAGGVATAPVALNITATAANVRILCAPSVELLPAIPFVASSLEGLGTFPLNAVNTGPYDYLVNSGEVDYNPILIGHEGPFSMASANVAGSGGTYTGGTQSLDVAIYEVAETGLPGKKLVDFGSLGGTTPFAAAGNVSNTPLTTPVWLEPGWYWQAVLAQFSGGSGTPRMRAFSGVLAASPGGTKLSSGAMTANQLSAAAAQTSLTDPAPAGPALNGNGYQWAVAYK